MIGVYKTLGKTIKNNTSFTKAMVEALEIELESNSCESRKFILQAELRNRKEDLKYIEKFSSAI